MYTSTVHGPPMHGGVSNPHAMMTTPLPPFYVANKIGNLAHRVNAAFGRW